MLPKMEIASDAVLANLKFRPKDDVTLRDHRGAGQDAAAQCGKAALISARPSLSRATVSSTTGRMDCHEAADLLRAGRGDPRHARLRCRADPRDPASTENCPSKAFSDLDNTQWYHEGVDYVLNNELMLGVGGSLFEPDGTVTRAQLAMVLYRVAGKPDVKNTAQSVQGCQRGRLVCRRCQVGGGSRCRQGHQRRRVRSRGTRYPSGDRYDALSLRQG